MKIIRAQLIEATISNTYSKSKSKISAFDKEFLVCFVYLFKTADLQKIWGFFSC